ncbi:MAG: DoxX family membrane protein [Deltaproteobacteria bacterium]|nr:DoxX family membrane protein [Deltaproteobacteria bacterium]
MTGAGSRTGAGGWIVDSVTLVARLALGAMFIYASWFKIVDPYTFAINIATYQILPDCLVNVLTITLPWLELVTGVLLIAGAFSREASLTIGAMLVMFIVAILIAMSKDLEISCGCFASEAAAADIGWPKVIEDAVMLAGAGWIVVAGSGRLSIDAMMKSWSAGRVKHGKGEKKKP